MILLPFLFAIERKCIFEKVKREKEGDPQEGWSNSLLKPDNLVPTTSNKVKFVLSMQGCPKVCSNYCSNYCDISILGKCSKY